MLSKYLNLTKLEIKEEQQELENIIRGTKEENKTLQELEEKLIQESKEKLIEALKDIEEIENSL